MLLGLTLGGVLLTHAGLQIVRAFPEDVRANASAAVKRRPRLVAVTAAVAVWTLVYALYSLAYPSGAAFLSAPSAVTAGTGTDSSEAAPIADNRELLAPSIGGELALSPAATATVTPEPTPTTTPTTAPPGDTTPPTTTAPAPPPEPEPCPFEAVADAFGPEAAEVLCPEGTAP